MLNNSIFVDLFQALNCKIKKSFIINKGFKEEITNEKNNLFDFIDKPCAGISDFQWLY